MTTIITLDAVSKRSFILPVNYESSDITVDVEDNLVARNGDFIVARNGDFIVAQHYININSRQILQSNKRNLSLPTVVLND